MSVQSRSPSSIIGFAFQVIFHLIFVIAGAVVLGFGYREYLYGGPLQSVAITSGVGILFIGVGLGGIYTKWRARSNAADPAPADTWDGAPWRVRPEWRNNTLVSGQGVDWGLTLFAVAWNLFSWPAASYAIYSEWLGPDFNAGVFIIAVFPLAGLGLGWLAVRGWLHRRKFGTTTLRLQRLPGRLGDALSMILQTGVRQEAAPDDGFHVRLTCYRRSVRYTTDSDGGRQREVNKEMLWRDEKHVRGRSYGTKGRVEVPVTFALPTGPPPSTPEKLEDRIMWEVDIDADVPGVDFNAAFEIPVFEPEMGAEASPQSVPFAADQSEAPVTRTTSQEASAQQLSADQDVNTYAQYELGASFSEPVSGGITTDRSPGGGLRLRFAAGRTKKLGVLWSVIAIVTGVGALLLILQSFVGTLVLGLIAGSTGYAAWQIWTVSSTLTIERGTIRLVRGSFGRGEPVVFPCTELADVTLKTSGHAGRTTFYDLRLHRMEAASQQQTQVNAEQADRVAAFLRRSGLVRADPKADEALSKIKESIREQSATIMVAKNLENKQEADWLVTTIQQAAIEEEQFA